MGDDSRGLYEGQLRYVQGQETGTGVGVGVSRLRQASGRSDKPTCFEATTPQARVLLHWRRPISPPCHRPQLSAPPTGRDWVDDPSWDHPNQQAMPYRRHTRTEHDPPASAVRPHRANRGLGTATPQARPWRAPPRPGSAAPPSPRDYRTDPEERQAILGRRTRHRQPPGGRTTSSGTAGTSARPWQERRAARRKPKGQNRKPKQDQQDQQGQRGKQVEQREGGDTGA